MLLKLFAVLGKYLNPIVMIFPCFDFSKFANSCKKQYLFFPAILLVLVACESLPTQSTNGSAATTQPIHESTLAPGLPDPILPTTTNAPEQVADLNNAVLFPGVRVAYLRERNAWLWTDGEGSRQLTTGNVYHTIDTAPDGQMIALRRGNEIWVVAADGTGERQLLSQAYLDGLSAVSGRRTALDSFGWFPGSNLVLFTTFQDEGEYPPPNYDLHLVDIGNPAPYQWLAPGQGGRLAFSPDGKYLAIAAQEWVDILDLGSGSRLRVIEYPGIANFETGYLPQVVWNADSSGFKTVIPPDAENGVNLGPAQFLFIFPNGTVARLGAFELVPLNRSIPSISPDGAYVLFASYVDQKKLALQVMDSSGAYRVYGEPGEVLNVYGWAPDSKKFVYGLGQPMQTYLGNVSADPVAMSLSNPQSLQWLDADHALAIDDNALILYKLDGTSTVLDSQVTQFEIIP